MTRILLSLAFLMFCAKTQDYGAIVLGMLSKILHEWGKIASLNFRKTKFIMARWIEAVLVKNKDRR